MLLGDKKHPNKTDEFNVGHIVDLAELGVGPGGCDVGMELKVVSSLKKTQHLGRGTAKHGGCIASVGHVVAFGNTEEELRNESLGCAQRGLPSDKPFNHGDGKGYVAPVKGLYDDALVKKKHKLDFVVHETSSGFSPPAVARMRRFGRKAASGVDRTKYPRRCCARHYSFVPHHTQRISVAIVRADAQGILKQLRRLRAAPRAYA